MRKRWWSTFSNNDTLYYRIALFLVPLIAGLTTGLLARRRASRGVLNALLLLTFPALLLPGFMYALAYTGFVEAPGNWGWLPSPLPALTALPCCLLLGCGAASLGGKLRQIGNRRRRKQPPVR